MMRVCNTSPVRSHDDQYDLLVAIDWENVGRFSAEIPMTADSLVVGDPDGGEFRGHPRQGHAVGQTSRSKKMAKTIEGGRPNMIALGAVAGPSAFPRTPCSGMVRDSLAKKGGRAPPARHRCVQAWPSRPTCRPAPRLATARGQSERRNGASPATRPPVSARCAAASASSPPSDHPGTEVLEWLAPSLAKLGGVLVQAEDETASISRSSALPAPACLADRHLRPRR